MYVFSGAFGELRARVINNLFTGGFIFINALMFMRAQPAAN